MNEASVKTTTKIQLANQEPKKDIKIELKKMIAFGLDQDKFNVITFHLSKFLNIHRAQKITQQVTQFIILLITVLEISPCVIFQAYLSAKKNSLPLK